MESHVSEETTWADGLAARLRIIQANFADDDPATRQSFLVEEIERNLKGCVPDRRRKMLAALSERFPSWQAAAPVRESPRATVAAPAPETTESLFDRLESAIPELSPEERAALVQRLERAGLMPQRQDAAFEVSPELQKRLGLNGERPISAERAAKILAMLLDTTLTLDQLVWTLWKQVAPRSTVRKEADFARLAGEYLAGSAEVSAAQAAQTLERVRKLIAGLLGGIGRAGVGFARERYRLFDPTAIEADARSEKKWNESVEFACWRKYVQLCREYGSEAVIEKGIQEAVAKAAENLMLGRPGS